MAESIHPDTRIGLVCLNVRDLDNSVMFYRDTLGLTLRDRTGLIARLGTSQRDLLILHHEPEARRAAFATGLYHVALLLPSREALADAFRHLKELGYPLQGAADHFVSEALYLADPEGNGIELYRDQPRARWPFVGGDLQMGTAPLDVRALREYTPATTWAGLPPATRIGHVHLMVDDTRNAEDFYANRMGFGLMQRFGREAVFLSAGGYHHHIGVNSWNSAGAPPPPVGSLGLRCITIDLVDDAEREQTMRRLEPEDDLLGARPAGSLVRDPAGNAVVLTVPSDR